MEHFGLAIHGEDVYLVINFDNNANITNVSLTWDVFKCNRFDSKDFAEYIAARIREYLHMQDKASIVCQQIFV